MGKSVITYDKFTAGVLSPRLLSRTDSSEYAGGVTTADNAFVLPEGPIQRRYGLQFKAETKDSSVQARLIKYQLNKDIAFELELGDQYIRFFNALGQVLETNVAITGVTQANPTVVTAVSHGYSNGDFIYITAVEGMTELNSSTIPYIVSNITVNTFELLDPDSLIEVDSTTYTAYSSGGIANRIYEIPSPYTESQLDDIQYAQSDVDMHLTHPEVPTQILTRTTDTSWELSEVEFLPPATYQSGYCPDAQLTPAATTGVDIIFTASAAVFLGGDAGRQISNKNINRTGRASITEVISSTQVLCDILKDFDSLTPIDSGDWCLDLSPLAALEFDTSTIGAIANIQSEYTSGSLGDKIIITAVTKASPGVVTTSTSHGYSNGQKVQIQDILGMTQINDKVFTVDVVTATTFQLKGENTTAYTTYASGGIVRQQLADIKLDVFRQEDVGKYILANGGVLQIVTVNSAIDIDAEVIKSMNTSSNTNEWSIEVPTWTSERGYPSSLCIYQQRLWLARNQTIWASETGLLTGFGVGPDDEDSIEVQVQSNESNAISWIRGARDLVVGTAGEEVTITSGNSLAISPSNIQSLPRTARGSSLQQVIKVGDEILFIDSSEEDIISFSYNFDIDGYLDNNLMFLAEHLTKEGDGLKELSWAKSPDRLIYSVLHDGSMLCTTYDKSLQIVGTTRFTTYGNFERVQTIATPSTDQVWCIIKRTINGLTKRFVELFDRGSGLDDTDSFSDSSLSLSLHHAITGISLAAPAVVTSIAHGLANSDSVIIKDLQDPEKLLLDPVKKNMSTINGIYTIANVTTDTFELLETDTTEYNAYGSNGNVWKRVTSITGLEHLEGMPVQIKGDGAVLPTQVVVNGSLLLPSAVGEVVIGLEYETVITTLDVDYDIGVGSMLAQQARRARVYTRVNNSGVPMLNGSYLPSRNAWDMIGQAVPLVNGYLEYGPFTWGNTTALTATLSDPLPLQMTGITGTIDSGIK